MSMICNKDIEILETLSTDNGWSRRTFQAYKYAANEYCTFNKKTLTDLLKEAEQEEIQKIRWKERTLLKRLITFRTHLIKNFRGDTVKSYFGLIKSIYNYNFIEIHRLPPINPKSITQNKQISFGDLPKKKHLIKGVELSKPDMAAIIFFMSSSGCARAEILSLKIKDFIYATHRHKYHKIPYEIDESPDEKQIIEKHNIRLLIEELMDQKKVIPTFNIYRGKTNKFHSTFCSHEAVQSILNHLLTRTDQKILNYDSKLFKTNIRYFSEKFKYINNTLKLGKAGKYNIFSSHMLRKYHASNLIRKGPSGHSLTEKQVDTLQGRGKIDSRKSYMFEDYESLREQYIECLDNITLYDNVSMIKRSKEYNEVKEELNEKNSELNRINNLINPETLAKLEKIFENTDEELLEEFLKQ